MGAIMRNGVAYGGGEITIELTQAEYDALEAQGLIDPNLPYYINNGILTTAPIDDTDISTDKTWSSAKIGRYSTDEEVVGTYLGKPRYRKVFAGISANISKDSLSTLLSSTYIQPLNISKLLNATLLSDGNYIFGYDYVRVDSNALQARGVQVSAGVNTVIIEYTKTTD